MKKNNIKSLIGKGIKIIPTIYSEEIVKRNMNKDKIKIISLLKKIGDGKYGFSTKTIRESNKTSLEEKEGFVVGIYNLGNAKVVIHCSIKKGKVDFYYVSTLDEYLNYIQELIEIETNEEVVEDLRAEYIRLSQ